MKRVLAVFNLDRNSDGVTNLETPLMPFAAISFLTGADIFLPASADHSGTIKVDGVSYTVADNDGSVSPPASASLPMSSSPINHAARVRGPGTYPSHWP